MGRPWRPELESLGDLLAVVVGLAIAIVIGIPIVSFALTAAITVIALQIAMIPMLAWIARNAPAHLKATFFAVMASFTNLALSASSLGTKYLNQIYEVTREVRDPATGAVTVPADYSQLGILLIVAAILAVVLPLVTIWLVQRSRYQTPD